MVRVLSGPSREGLAACSLLGGPPSLPLPGPVERGGLPGAVVRSGAGSPAPLLRVSLCLLCQPSVHRQRPASGPGGPWFLSLSESRTSPFSLRLFFPSILAVFTASLGKSLPLADTSRTRSRPMGQYLWLDRTWFGVYVKALFLDFIVSGFMPMSGYSWQLCTGSGEAVAMLSDLQAVIGFPQRCSVLVVLFPFPCPHRGSPTLERLCSVSLYSDNVGNECPCPLSETAGASSGVWWN